MSEAYTVSVQGRPDIRELIFAMEPRAGDLVRLPDLDGDLHMQIKEIIHHARLTRSNNVADTTIMIVPERRPFPYNIATSA